MRDDFLQAFLIVGIISVITLFIITVGFLIGSSRVCVESHTERYYDSSGTSMWVATKNPAFLGMNGYRTRTVCDRYEEAPRESSRRFDSGQAARNHQYLQR